MNQKEEIKKLLEKYEEGLSNLKEEKQLRYYFLFEEVHPELESYKLLFQFYESEKQVEFKEIPIINEVTGEVPKVRFIQYWKLAVAAVLVIGFGISWYFNYQSGPIESLSHKEVLLAQKYLNIGLGALDKNYVRSAQLLSNTRKIEESTEKVRKMGEVYGTQRNQLQYLNYIDESFKKLENIKSIQKSRIKLVM
jgi:hypothetical protein